MGREEMSGPRRAACERPACSSASSKSANPVLRLHPGLMLLSSRLPRASRGSTPALRVDRQTAVRRCGPTNHRSRALPHRQGGKPAMPGVGGAGATSASLPAVSVELPCVWPVGVRLGGQSLLSLIIYLVTYRRRARGCWGLDLAALS